MGKILGNDRRLFVKDTTKYNWIAGEQNNSVSLSADFIETSDKGSAWKDGLSGKKGGTISGTLYVDASNDEQGALLTALVNGTEVDWAVGAIADGGASVNVGYYGKGIITSISDSNNVGEAVSRTIEIQTVGAVTVVD